MRLVVHTIEDGTVDVADFDPTSLMTMLEQWDAVHVLGFALDDGMAYIPKASIIRVDTFD